MIFKLKSQKNKKKFLISAAMNLVLTLIIEIFPLNGIKASAAKATVGPFTVIGGTEGIDFEYASPVLTIHSGNITVSTSGETSERIVVDGASTITLAGVNISKLNESDQERGAALKIIDNATFDVNILLADNSENILKATKANFAGLQKSDNGTVAPGKLTIAGNGKLTAIGEDYGAGIGGGYKENGTNIAISGGEVTAIGGEDGGAGIGGGEHGSGTNITISGGIVEAKGGAESAGIGGGSQGNGTNIIISSGTVIATGGDGGAGIGGGEDIDGDINYGNGTDITITGGEVIATGGPSGAGIGGGNKGDGIDITIEGGKIKATGGKNGGAGIGGGDSAGSGSNITIESGEVIATGGNYGAGIGGGGEGDGSNITIEGGKVMATGGDQAAGIGGGTQARGTEIEITGGQITVIGGNYAAGIGGGEWGSGENNSLNGNTVVLATSGDKNQEALQGFDEASGGSLTQGIVFTGVCIYDDDSFELTGIDWGSNGTMYGDSVIILYNVEFPSNLTIGTNQTLIVDAGAILTILSGATLQNEGRLIVNGVIDCSKGGEVTIKVTFYNMDGRNSYQTGYQIYQTSTGVHKYKELPNPNQLDSKDATNFEGWYTQPGGPDSGGTKVDENINVLPNNHSLYEYRVKQHTIFLKNFSCRETKSTADQLSDGYSLINGDKEKICTNLDSYIKKSECSTNMVGCNLSNSTVKTSDSLTCFKIYALCFTIILALGFMFISRGKKKKF